MPYEKSNKEIQESKVKGFKMKGSPMKRNFGIGADSPMKETIGLTGANISPRLSYNWKSAEIPSFRDIVSLEQQQAYADKVDAKRAKKKEKKEWEKKEKAGAHTLGKEDIDLSKKEAPELTTQEVATEEAKPENEIEVGSNVDSYGTGTSNMPFNPYQ